MFYLNIFALSVIIPLVLGRKAPLEPVKTDSTPSVSKIQNNLGPQLCRGGSLYFPSSREFADLTERWSAASEGDILVVIVANCEKDVTTAVKFANLAGLPFLATNRGHGTPLTLNKIKNGVLIKLQNLNTIDIAEDGKSALLGGGVYVDQVLEKLAIRNKVTSECNFNRPLVIKLISSSDWRLWLRWYGRSWARWRLWQVRAPRHDLNPVTN